MANSNKLAEVVAMLEERDQDFRPIADAAMGESDQPFWAISELKRLLGYAPDESIDNAVNRAKITAGRANWVIKEHFVDGQLFDAPGEVCVSKYAALLVIMEADSRKQNVANAKAYFALQADKQRLEDEKRLRTRLDVATENNKLNGIAKSVGVTDFCKFNGVGFAALYGGKNVAQVQREKGIPSNGSYLDFAGSEELAANLFRITQTSAALKRQAVKSEQIACNTHKTVAQGIRKTIIDAGNTPPERLPAAKTKIDLVATQVKKNVLPK